MSRKPLDRRALFASGAAAALLAATGVSAGPLPRRGGKLGLALSGATRRDDWLQGDGLFMQVARLGVVFDTLTEVAADGTLHGALASKWSCSDDAQVWTFQLRSDVNFHDGAAFTSKDVVHSLAGLGEVHALGDDAVQIKLAASDPSLPFTLAQAGHIIRPAHAPQAGIGTGLYAVQHFSAGQRLLAHRQATHWRDGQAGWFDTIELVSIPCEKVRGQALAEYLVDGADISDPTLLSGFDDIAAFDGQAVLRSIAMPMTVGRGVLDDLRAPQRWWGA